MSGYLTFFSFVLIGELARCVALPGKAMRCVARGRNKVKFDMFVFLLSYFVFRLG